MADYNYIVKSIFNAKPKYNVSFDRANGTVNIGGVGYRGGSLSSAFKSSGSSSDILNNFFKANENPQKTKREVEKISKGKIKVKIGKGYGNEPIVYYSLKESQRKLKMINLKDILTESVMPFEDAHELVKKLKKQIDAPEVDASIATLGGREKPSVILSVSINPKNEWPNGIYMNSMYSKFYITYDGIIEQFAKNYKIKKKFRKSRFKNTDDVIKKINKYIKEIEKTINESKVHYQKKLKNGTTFQVIGRDTKGMRGTQDKFQMQIVDKSGKVVRDLGSHPSVKGAEKFGNKFESVNEEKLKPKKLTQLKKGEKFVFNNTPYEFVELYTDISNAAKVKKEDGKTSVVSFGGGVVNKNTKGGFSDYLKQGGRVWDNVNPNNSPSVNEGKRDLDLVVDTIRKEYENVPIKKLAYHLANKTTYTIDQLLMVLRAYKDMNARDRDKTDLKKLFKSYGLKESTVNEDTKNTFNSFKKDFDNVITHANAYLEGNKITIYLDTNPNKEKNIINKLIRTKYSDKLKKARSEDDVMVFKITERQYESVNERYRPNLESKGWEAAQKVIRQLQSSVFKKLDDDELLEFRKAIADAFNLDGILK